MTTHGLMTTPLALTGFNASSIAIGDDDGYDVVAVAQNPDGAEDQLIEVTQLPVRPMYHDAGFTTDSRLYIRRPALLHAMEVDQAFNRFFGWRIRITDPYRPWNVQAAGHTQAIKDAAMTLGLDLSQVKDMISDALNHTLPEDGMRFLMKILKAAQPIFSAVPLLGETPDGLDPQLAKSAANLGLLLNVPLNRYAQNTHATGGVPDMEPIDADTGKLINMGCPVDFVGIVSALGFFEEAPPTILLPDLEKAEIAPSLSYRLGFFRTEVSGRDNLQQYLTDTGVSVEEFLHNDTYFNTVCAQIQANRRGWGNVMALYDLPLYGLEWWHGDCNDARGGIRSQRTGIVSGGPSYAIYKGQPNCAWGNCTKQYEAIVAARR